MNDVLEWVEKAALENLRNRRTNIDVLAREAQVTLTACLAGGAAALAYTIKTLETGSTISLTVASLVLTFYLFALCAMAVVKTMMIAPVPSLMNDPRNLNQEGFELDALRRVELRNIQERIDQCVARADRMALWLNRVRVGAVAAPVVWAVAFLCLEAIVPAARAAVGG